MLFNSIQFFVFFAVVLVLFYVAPRPWRKFILLIASYYFYMSWNYKFVPLLLTLTAIDYTAALWIERSPPASRKPFLIVGLVANLGFLGFFKYYNFLADNLVRLLHLQPHSYALSIILPLGISFHTFQSMSYLVDVYRGEQKAIRNPIDYALFISTRYREALHEGVDPERAVVHAIDTSGRAVLFAGGTVVISLLGLFVIGVSFIRGLAIGASLAVLLVMAAAVTLLPAVLGFVGHTIDKWALPSAKRKRSVDKSFWTRWSRTIQARPWPAALGG